MSDRAAGHKRWYVPDCYLPMDRPEKGDYVSHESCCILNVGGTDARCALTLYFEDRDPVRGIELIVGSERCWHVRFDRLQQIAGVTIPQGVPYALGIESDVNVVVQHSRLDTRDAAIAYMSVLGYAED